MRLAYFASPYELLDVERPGQDHHFTKEGTCIQTVSSYTSLCIVSILYAL